MITAALLALVLQGVPTDIPGEADGGLSEADEPITVLISRPAFDFKRQTALFMRNCHMVFYRRDENGAWRPLAESELNLCALAE